MRKIDQRKEKILKNEEYADRFKRRTRKEERKAKRKEFTKQKERKWADLQHSGFSWI